MDTFGQFRKLYSQKKGTSIVICSAIYSCMRHHFCHKEPQDNMGTLWSMQCGKNMKMKALPFTRTLVQSWKITGGMINAPVG